MLIKGNKSKKREMAKKATQLSNAPKNATLPDQIMNFIGEEVAKKYSDKGIIDEKALDEILGKKLSKLDLSKEHYSKEEIEAKAQAMVNARAEELMQELEKEIAEKKEAQEQELAQIKAEAQAKANEILEQAQQHVLNEAKKLDEIKKAFEKEKEKHFDEIDHLHKEAYKAAIEEAKPYVNETVEIFKNIQNSRVELAQLIKDNLATIAFDVAKQILKYEVHVNDNILEQQVLHSVNKLLDSKGVMKIALNPQDKAKEADLSELLKNVLDSSIRLVFLYDEQVDMGSCTIETQGGKLNSKFSSQLDTIKARFEQYLGHKISILPDEPLIMEFNGSGIADDQFIEDTQMAKNKSDIKIKPSSDMDEPTEADLMELEDNFEDIANLDIGEDLGALLDDILEEEGSTDTDPEFKASKKSSDKEAKVEDISLIDLDDSAEIGANDYANGNDWSEDDEEFLEDLSEKSEDEEYQDEEGNTFVEYNEFQDDENFGDSGESGDDRFPEY